MDKYIDRPSILDLPQSSTQTAEDLNKIRNFVYSMQMLITELLLFFPKYNFFFIGRDMEYAYDICRLLFNHKPNLLNRFNLINVSRENIESKLFKIYCQQKIFSKKGGIVLIDSGFNGNIINSIIAQNTNYYTKGFLLCSANSEFTSSHYAMMALNIPFDTKYIIRKDIIEQNIEYIPHFTAKSIDYKFYDNELNPISSKSEQKWKDAAIDLMMKIKHVSKNELTFANWEKTYKILSFFFRNLIYIYNKPIYAVLNGDIYFDTVGTEKQLPMGFWDFTREAIQRTQNNEIKLRIRFSSKKDEKNFSDYLNNNINIIKPEYYSYLIEIILKRDWEEINSNNSISIPIDKGNLDFQKSYAKAWEILEELNPQKEVPRSQLNYLLNEVLKLENGKGFIRDVLTQSFKNNLSIRFREDVIGMLWDLCLDKK